ncbi:MAG: glycosyltransferase family A protein [Paludibacter sp.]
MPQKTLFSVIIPTFNRSDRLKIALESLVSQTCKDFEVIVCDDGSTDDTQEIAESFKNLLTLNFIWNENWGGPARPRNIGIENAYGEWICFLDSDDFWYPEKLTHCLPYLDDSDFIYHDFDVFGDNSEKKIGKKICRDVSNQDAFHDLLLKWNGIVNSGVVIRKSILDKAGQFFEDKSFILDEDFEMWLRIAKLTNRFTRIRKILGGYYLSESGISRDIDKSLARERFLLEKYRNDLHVNQFQNVIGLLELSCGIRHLGNQDIKAAKRNFTRVLTQKNAINLKFKALIYIILGKKTLLLIDWYTNLRMTMG